MSIHRRDDPAIGDGLHRLTMGDSDGINLERNHAADGIWNALSLAGIASCVVDSDAVVAWCNTIFAELLGRNVNELVGMSLVVALGGDQEEITRGVAAVAEERSSLQRLEVTAVDSTGLRRRLALSAAVTSAWDEPDHLAIIAEDLTPERRALRARQLSTIEMVKRSTQDGLTGLPNRGKLELLLAGALRRAAREVTPIAVLFCDLDGFKAVNDQLGHSAGDDLLKLVAQRLTHTLRLHDVLGRIGGDEFVVITEEVTDEETARQVADRLIAAVSEPITIDGTAVNVGMTVGFTMATGREDAKDLIAEADRAMYAAKRAGKGRSMSLSQVIEAARRADTATG